MYDSMVCWALAVNMSWDRCKQSRERLHMLTQSICWHWWTVDFYLSSKDTGRLQYLLSCSQCRSLLISPWHWWVGELVTVTAVSGVSAYSHPVAVITHQRWASVAGLWWTLRKKRAVQISGVWYRSGTLTLVLLMAVLYYCNHISGTVCLWCWSVEWRGLNHGLFLAAVWLSVKD